MFKLNKVVWKPQNKFQNYNFPCLNRTMLYIKYVNIYNDVTFT